MIGLAALTVGCGGKVGRDGILGTSGIAALAPSVVATTPVSEATGVRIVNPIITATFNESMSAIAGAASFPVTCAAPCVSPTGAVTLDATSKIATFTLTPTSALAPLTLYTATISGATSRAAQVALATPYVWHFTTGVAPPAPTVTAVAPVNHAAGVSINDAISATFSEAVAPFGGAATFNVTCAAPCTSPAGIAALDASSGSLTFTPAIGLAPLTLYTVTITDATSLATGLVMAAPYVWQFTTGLVPDTTRPAVLLTSPVTTTPAATGVPVNSSITAAFTEDMAPATISGTSFTITCAAPCVSPAGSVSYQVGARTVVFAPSAALAAATSYTVTVTTAATDLAGNALAGNQAPLPAASNYVWSFTTAAAVSPPVVTPPVVTPPVTPPVVTPPVVTVLPVAVRATNPTLGETGVCPNASINATFTVPSGLRMDPTTGQRGNIHADRAVPGVDVAHRRIRHARYPHGHHCDLHAAEPTASGWHL
jgi:hypothetical protein